MTFFPLAPKAERWRPAQMLLLGQLYSMMRYDSWEGDPQDVEERSRGPMEQGVDIDAHPSGGQRLTFRESHEIMLGAPSRDFLHRRPWPPASMPPL